MMYPEDTIRVVAVADTQRIIRLMTEWKDRAKARMAELGLRQQDLIPVLGVETRGAVGHYLSGRRAPSTEQLVALAKVLQFNGIADLLGTDQGIGQPSPSRVVKVPAYEIEAVEDDEDFDPEREVWVEGFDIEVSGGPGRPIPEYVPTQYRQRFTLKWLHKTGAKAKDLIILGVRGHSMERTLFDGDKVVADRGNTRVISNHVYVIIAGGEVRVKRLFRAADGRMRIVSDNPDKVAYPDEFIEPDSGDFLVLGRVIDKSGPGGL